MLGNGFPALLARKYTPEAVKELARLAVNARSEAIRVAAIRELFDRGYGKATSPPVDVELPVIGQWDGTDAVLRAYRTIIEAVSDGRVSPAEALELFDLIEAQRVAVNGLRTEAQSQLISPLSSARLTGRAISSPPARSRCSRRGWRSRASAPSRCRCFRSRPGSSSRQQITTAAAGKSPASRVPSATLTGDDADRATPPAEDRAGGSPSCSTVAAGARSCSAR